MPEARFQPITVRITRTVLLWGLTGALLVGVTAALLARRGAEARLQGALQDYAQTLAPDVADAMYELEQDRVKAQLSTALLIRGVGYAAAIERDNLFAESGDPGMRNAVDALAFPLIRRAAPAPGTGNTVHREHGVLTVRSWTQHAVASQENRSIGVLKIAVDHAAIEREAWTAAGWAALPCLLLTGVVLATALIVVRRHLQRPMREMADFLDGLDAGRLDERLTLSRQPRAVKDEMDLMAAGFASLQDRIATHVGELDARVAERTKQLQIALDKLKVLAITDPLTGCHNRLAFSQRFPEALAHAQRYGRPLSLVFCDVDRFKSINDNHGHPVGDQVLTAMGHCLRDALRASSDWVARYGGEEFVLVLPETPLSQAQDVAERLRQQIEQTVAVALPDGRTLRVTASLGVAEYRPGERGEDLLTRADEQLYAAKQAGRNQVQPPLAVAV